MLRLVFLSSSILDHSTQQQTSWETESISEVWSPLQVHGRVGGNVLLEIYNSIAVRLHETFALLIVEVNFEQTLWGSAKWAIFLVVIPISLVRKWFSGMEGLNKLLATSESLATQIGDNGGVVKNLRRGVRYMLIFEMSYLIDLKNECYYAIMLVTRLLSIPIPILNLISR